MKIIADLQLHSRYSRAVSKYMQLPEISKWSVKKGVDLVATGDWMHPVWMSELQAGLVEWSEGIFASKEHPNGAKFLLSGELSSIYTDKGRGRRVHTLVFSPSIKICLKINEELTKRGCNLSSDGRPIIGLPIKQIAEIVFEADERCLVIPAHVWTPWFGVYGSKSGFDSLEEAFGEYSDRILAIETGLSSDPEMNWRIEELKSRAILSFSDAHSPAKIGREATVFCQKDRMTNDKLSNFKFSYSDIYWAIAERSLGRNEGKLKIDSTLEFYPEEGKYHWDGHRKCEVVHSPGDTRNKGLGCSVCGRSLTVGVEYRVEELSNKLISTNKPISNNPIKAKKIENELGVVEYFHPNDSNRPSFVKFVPLLEILSEVVGVGVGSKKVRVEYERLLSVIGSEFEILLQTKIEEIEEVGGERLAEAILRVRKGEIAISPGYDGVFGEVKIWGDEVEKKEQKEQMTLF